MATIAQEEKRPAPANFGLVLLAAVAGWLVPGLGHLLLRRWRKAIVYFLAVGMMAVIGILVRGDVFTSAAGDAFGMLGYFADLGTGIFYFLAHTINPAGPNVARAAGDYGTRMIATAGVLNLLCVLELFHLGLGHGERHGLG